MLRFVLFDIDQTLIDAKGAGARALACALQELFGERCNIQGLEMAGKTDLQIVKEALGKGGVDCDDELLLAVSRSYIRHLRREMASCRGHLMPGVKELLPRLREEKRVRLGLLTGNLEEGARLKLGPFGLNEFFPVGAFGGDSEDRNQLLPVAVKRLQALAGVLVPFQECIVIGDTPRDVACAKVHGSSCIGVATGRFSVQALRSAGADLALEDLSRTEEVLAWIMGQDMGAPGRITAQRNMPAQEEL
ncbi:MAG: HAD family hydrolase [bacterium]